MRIKLACLQDRPMKRNCKVFLLTLLEPPGFGNFRKKNQQFLVALPTP